MLKTNQDKLEEILFRLGIKLIGEPPNTSLRDFKLECKSCANQFESSLDKLKRYLKNPCRSCMPKKRRLEKSDFDALAELRELRWTGKLQVPRNIVSNWKCMNCGMNIQISFQQLTRKTYGCLPCARKKIVSVYVAEIREFFKIELIGLLPKTTSDTAEWKCSNDHKFRTSISNIKAGRACLLCGREKTVAFHRHTNSRYNALGEIARCEFLGPLPVNVNSKTRWKCNLCKLVFDASYRALERAGKCPGCSTKASIKRMKSPVDEYREAGLQFGWLFLGPEVDNQHQSTWWKCAKKGHGKFEAYLKHVKKGSGCQKCGWDRSSSSQRATADQYHALAQACKCAWIGKVVPKKASIPTLFRCAGQNKYKQIHSFKRTYQKLLFDRKIAEQSKLSVCPRCASFRRQSRPQEAVYHLLKGRGKRYREVRFGLWYIDIVLVSRGIKIAIEYDGWYRHKNRLEKDRLKRKALRLAGYKTLRIKGGAKIPEKSVLHEKIDNLLSSKHTRNWAEITLSDWADR